jgi:recombination protein RecA
MPTAATQIRAEIEAALAGRIASALTPAPRLVRPTAGTGIPALDQVLEGGLPLGAISEIVGPESSGRTSLSLAFLAQMTQQGKVCAWIDVSDTLHPESAAAAGVDLDRLLWVRCGKAPGIWPPGQAVSSQAKEPNHEGDLQPPLAALETKRVQLGGNSPHPRSESIGLPSAIGDLLAVKAKYKRDKIVGTPGAPNRPLGDKASLPGGGAKAPSSGKEQVASDRLPSRRGQYVLEQREAYEPHCAEPQHKARPQKERYEPRAFGGGSASWNASLQEKPWSRLDQALRVADLLLQAGGFSAIVLDMGSISPEFASRVPLATWFRYRAAAERTQASFLLLTQHACTKSSAGLVLRLDAAQPKEAGATVFAGLRNQAEITRSRFCAETAASSHKVTSIKKPVQRANHAAWLSRTTWAGRR